MDYITFVFHVPLEAKGLCDPSMIQDEVEEVVVYAPKFSRQAQKVIAKSVTSCTHVLIYKNGRTFFYYASLYSACYSPAL